MLAWSRNSLRVLLIVSSLLAGSGLSTVRPVNAQGGNPPEHAQNGNPPGRLDEPDVMREIDPNAGEFGDFAFVEDAASLEAAATGIVVSVYPGTTVAVSQFASGISHVDDSLAWANQGAMVSARSVVASSTRFENTHIQGWGVSNPWPDPNRANPHAWEDLDTRIALMVANGTTPMITMAEAPWWMKGQRQADGSVKLIPDARGEYEPYTYTTAFTDFRGIR
jgi:hypothetical protein